MLWKAKSRKDPDRLHATFELEDLAACLVEGWPHGVREPGFGILEQGLKGWDDALGSEGDGDAELAQ